jgi:hypothetical protein
MAKVSSEVANPFSKLSPADVHRLVIVSSGADKTGKNHFGYTMPGPVFGMYFDPGGAEGVAQKFIRGEVAGFPKKDILAKYYKFRKDKQDQEMAKDVRDEFEEDYAYALSHGAKSLQIDESELWEVYRFAEYGRESSKGIFYGPLNRRVSGLIQDAIDAGVNLQLIQKVKTKWVDDKPTDDVVARGYGDAKYIAQVNLYHTFGPEGFGIQVVNCRQNMQLSGNQYYNTDFPELASAVFPETSESDWK